MAASKTLTFDIFGRDKTASKTIRGVGKSADAMGDKLHKVGVGIGISLAAAGAGAVAFGIDSVKAYAEAEKSQMRLADAYERFPAMADTNLKSLGKLNSQLAKKTRFDDDATAAAQANLAQFKLTGKQVEKLTPLMQDYAAKTGKELPDAANDLGKALLGQGRALKQIGVDFEDTGSVAGNFDSIVASLNEKVGGFANVEGASASGRLEIMKNRFGEVQEQVGEAFLPAMETAADSIDTTFMPAIENAADWLATTGIPAVEDFAVAFGNVQQASYDFGYNMAENLKPASEALAAFWEDVKPVVDKFSEFWQSVGYNVAEFLKKGQPVPQAPNIPKPKNPPAVSIPTPKFKGDGASTGKYPGLATGGTAMSRGMALIGERGPELLHLPKGASVIPLNRAGSGGDGSKFTMIVQPAPGMSEETIGRVAANSMKQGMRRYA